MALRSKRTSRSARSSWIHGSIARYRPGPAACSVPALVVRVRVDPGGGKVFPDMLVSPGVLAETMDEQQRRPRIVGGPVPREQYRAVGDVATRPMCES